MNEPPGTACCPVEPLLQYCDTGIPGLDKEDRD